MINKSGSKSLPNREIAREALYKCINNHRRAGLKTVAALDQVAPFLGISRRKVHRLFFNENYTRMGNEERHLIIMGVVKAHLWLARQLREWADEIDREAALQEERERSAWRDDTSPELSA